MDVIPTEILERLEVSKTIAPDMDGDAIGGRVNLKAISPFDKGEAIRINQSQMLYNDLVDDFSPIGGAAYGDVFGREAIWDFSFPLAYRRRRVWIGQY